MEGLAIFRAMARSYPASRFDELASRPLQPALGTVAGDRPPTDKIKDYGARLAKYVPAFSTALIH